MARVTAGQAQAFGRAQRRRALRWLPRAGVVHRRLHERRLLAVAGKSHADASGSCSLCVASIAWRRWRSRSCAAPPPRRVTTTAPRRRRAGRRLSSPRLEIDADRTPPPRRPPPGPPVERRLQAHAPAHARRARVIRITGDGLRSGAGEAPAADQQRGAHRDRARRPAPTTWRARVIPSRRARFEQRLGPAQVARRRRPSRPFSTRCRRGSSRSSARDGCRAGR